MLRYGSKAQRRAEAGAWHKHRPWLWRSKESRAMKCGVKEAERRGLICAYESMLISGG